MYFFLWDFSSYFSINSAVSKLLSLSYFRKLIFASLNILPFLIVNNFSLYVFLTSSLIKSEFAGAETGFLKKL